ncbi:MAG: helix-turn-helix domain-containing protein [Acetatifactor sp.]
MASGNTVFSTNLQMLRKRQGVTQEQLASHLGVSPQAVSKWENGSYPEGDLLPRISEFFGVSISYLYGQEKESVSIEQSVLDALYGIMGKYEEKKDSAAPDSDKKDVGERKLSEMKEINGHPDYFDLMLKLAWAFQIGAWKNNKQYYDRGVPEKDTRTASVFTDDAGFGFFNLNLEKQFFFLTKEPWEGFAKNLKITEEMRTFFTILGKKGALEIIYYMLTLRGEYVTVPTIAKNIGKSVEKTEQLLQEILQFQQFGNPPFYCIDIIGQDRVEKGYGINQSCICMFISLFLNADVLIHPPCGYQMQVNSRAKSWFQRKDVEEMIKDGNKDGETV